MVEDETKYQLVCFSWVVARQCSLQLRFCRTRYRPIMFANMIDFVPSVTHRGISSEDDPIAIGALLFLLSADMVKQ